MPLGATTLYLPHRGRRRSRVAGYAKGLQKNGGQGGRRKDLPLSCGKAAAAVYLSSSTIVMARPM